MHMSRSTYYYKTKKSDRSHIVAEIEKIATEFPRYGYRRVTHALVRKGIHNNHKLILKLMREHGLLCKRRKKFKVKTTDSNHPYPVYPNLIKELIITRLNQVWVSDITYVQILRGFVYLACILDALSRKVIGWALSRNINKVLTLSALKMAIKLRNPQPGCIHHSDRGVQYAACDYVDYLKAHKFEISMSKKGSPYDNAMAESFFKTYKYDEVYLSEYTTYEDVINNTARFLDDVYNAKRLHSSIGYLTPNEFEAEWQDQNMQNDNLVKPEFFEEAENYEKIGAGVTLTRSLKTPYNANESAF